MRYVYYAENTKNPIPDELLELVDHTKGGVSRMNDALVLVLTENLPLTEVRDALNADTVELTYAGEVGPGTVLVDKPGFRLALAED